MLAIMTALMLSGAMQATDFTDTDVKTWAPEIIDGRFLEEFKGQAVSMQAAFFGDNSRKAWGYTDLDGSMRGVIRRVFLGAESPYKTLMMVCLSPRGLAKLTAEEQRREPLRNKGLLMPGKVFGTVQRVVFDEQAQNGAIRIELEPGCQVEFVIPALTAEQEAALPELQLPGYLADELAQIEKTYAYVEKVNLNDLVVAMLRDQQISVDEYDLLTRLYQGPADFRVTNTDTGNSFTYRNYVAQAEWNNVEYVLSKNGKAISAELAPYLWQHPQADPQHLLAALNSDDGYQAMVWHLGQHIGHAYLPAYEPDTKSMLMKQPISRGLAIERTLTEQADKDLVRNFTVDAIQQSSFMRAEGTEPLPDYSFRFLRPVDSERAKQQRERDSKKLPMEPLVALDYQGFAPLQQVSVPVVTYSKLKYGAEKGPNVLKTSVQEMDLWNAMIADNVIDKEEYRLLRQLFSGARGVQIIASDRSQETHPPYTYDFNFNLRENYLGFTMPHYTKRRLVMYLQTNGGFAALDPPIATFTVDNAVYSFMKDLNNRLIGHPQLVPANLARQLRDHLYSNKLANPSFQSLLEELAGPSPFVWLKTVHEGQEHKILFLNLWHDNAKRELLR